jgi:hypothetical protein
MKSIIQKSLVIALVYYSMIFIGCVKDDCGKGGRAPKKGKFRYSSISSENLLYEFKRSTEFSTSISIEDTISKNSYGLKFLLDYTTAYLPKKKAINSFSINTAYACSLVPDNFTSSDTIKKISIKTLLDLDVAHLAGSDATEYFNEVYQFYSASEPIRYEKAFSMNSRFSDHYESSGTMEYDLYFNHSAIESKTVAFELIIEYTNGNNISAKTKPVFLK